MITAPPSSPPPPGAGPSRFPAEGDGQAVWEDFAADGALDNVVDLRPAAPTESIAGVLAATVTLAPGESRTVPFVLAWDRPITAFGHGRRFCPPEGFTVHVPLSSQGITSASAGGFSARASPRFFARILRIGALDPAPGPLEAHPLLPEDLPQPAEASPHPRLLGPVLPQRGPGPGVKGFPRAWGGVRISAPLRFRCSGVKVPGWPGDLRPRTPLPR